MLLGAAKLPVTAADVDWKVFESNVISISLVSSALPAPVRVTPSETDPWGWQVDGHHLDINYFVLGDQVVMTPTFMWSEPVTVAETRFVTACACTSCWCAPPGDISDTEEHDVGAVPIPVLAGSA